MRTGRKRRKRKVISELNITNLVDVTFALLIIFMIAAPMMTQGVQVDLPKAEAENVEATESIQVTITGKNEIYIDRERVRLLQFRKRFREVFGGRTDVPVFVNADRKVPYGLVIRIIGDIQRAGVVKLGFLTLPVDKKG
ncbi:MAG: protein TolR [Chitinivibrionales bacterium]|nr:protein TolR [Chitinivibrionales bacterium]